MIPELEILQRVAVAALLGLIIGFERERQDHAAGLRTHMILVIGAALAMPLSINLALQFADITPGGDPARLASQVISGIGFLGAGVIFRAGGSVRGLTTAASLWTVTVIGLAVGAGLYLSGAIITVALLFVLTIVNYVEDHWIAGYNRLNIHVYAKDRPALIGDVKQLLAHKQYRYGSMGMEKDLTQRQVMLNFHVRIRAQDALESLADQIGALEGVDRVQISE